jgi:hypothetical protein
MAKTKAIIQERTFTLNGTETARFEKMKAVECKFTIGSIGIKVMARRCGKWIDITDYSVY